MTSSTRTFGLLGLALVLTLSGFAPSHAASHGGDEMASVYSNFYEAVGNYSENHDGELSSMKAFIDAYPGIKSFFESETNGTLLAPSNAAATDFLTAVGYGATGNAAITPSELLSFPALKDAVEEALQLHFLNGSYPDSMYHPWWLSEAMNVTADTLQGENLYLRNDGNETTDGDLAVFYDSDYNSPAATVTNVDAIRTNDTDFPEGHEGHVHIIDTVMLPSDVRSRRFNFKDIIDTYTGDSATQRPFTLDTTAAAVGKSNDALYTVLGPNLQGAVFAPTDTAWTAFISSYDNFNAAEFLGNTDMVKRVLYEHIVNSQAVTASDNTTTSYSTYQESGESGAGTGATVMVQFEDQTNAATDGPYQVIKLKNERGEEADVVESAGPNFQGGWIYVIDKVLVSNSTHEFLSQNRSTTAGGNWKNVLPSGITTADADAAEDLLSSAGLGDLMDNDEEFNFWLPTADARDTFLSSLEDLDLDGLKGRQDQLREFMNSYRVSSTQYDGTDEGGGTMSLDTFYQTENENVELKKMGNGDIEVRDVATGRRLLAEGSATGAIEFGNGKVIYYMSSIPVTSSMQQAVLDSGASQAYPSIFTMSWAALAAIVALLSL